MPANSHASIPNPHADRIGGFYELLRRRAHHPAVFFVFFCLVWKSSPPKVSMPQYVAQPETPDAKAARQRRVQAFFQKLARHATPVNTAN